MLNRCVARSGTCGQSPRYGLDLGGVEPYPVCSLFDPVGVGIEEDIGYRRCRFAPHSRLRIVGRFHRPVIVFNGDECKILFFYGDFKIPAKFVKLRQGFCFLPYFKLGKPAFRSLFVEKNNFLAPKLAHIEKTSYFRTRFQVL